MKCEPAGPSLFHFSLGNGFGWPFTSSATEIEWSSDQKGKFTKTRPDIVETPTPVTCCSGKRATSLSYAAKTSVVVTFKRTRAKHLSRKKIRCSCKSQMSTNPNKGLANTII